MTRSALPPLVLAVVALAAAVAPAAEAGRGPCIPGQEKPTCWVRMAKVMSVADGDTVHVKIRQGGRSVREDVRLTGVDALELTDYSRPRRRGRCHAVDAAERLEYLLQGRRIKRRKIRLASVRRVSRSAGRRGRLRRAVAFRRAGRWHDAGAVLLKEGHVLHTPKGTEWAWNKRYAKLAARAALSGKRIWDTDFCGTGPQPASALRMKVKWNADGDDGRNLNGEWVRITNLDPFNDVSLHDWRFRDSGPGSYRFPRRAVVPAGRSIRLRVGRGNDDANTFHWGESAPVFGNVRGGRRKVGDGGYLFDPQGDLRAWVMYPCSIACTEPLKGKVRITAHRRDPEWIGIKNISNAPVDLSEYEVESVPYFYEFSRGTVLGPGHSIYVVVKWSQARDLPFAKGWGLTRRVLGDGSDVVSLRNPLGAPVTCASWGRGPRSRCPRF